MMRVVGSVTGGLLLLLFAGAVIFWLRHRAPDVPMATLEARYGRPSSRYADLGDGLRVHWLKEGRADAPAIVLIHGFGDNAFSWDGWAHALGRDHRVLAVDLPGHGLTATPAGTRLDPATLADTLATWFEFAGLDRAAVAGNSLGGAVAWQLAARHPDRVSHLILVDAAGWPAAPATGAVPLAFRIMRYRLGRAVLASIDNKPLIREGLRKDVGDRKVITEAFIDRWADLQRAPGHRPILMTLDPAAIDTAPAELKRVHAPTLILWGQADPIIPVADAERFHKALPGSELITYPHVGHLPQVEVPARSATDVAAFLVRRPTL